MRKFIVIALLFASIAVYCQSTKSAMDEAFRELNGNLTLTFSDALNGKPINEAKVTINKVGEFTSNTKGEIYFPIPEKDGIYTVKFSRKGYITSKFEIEIAAGTIFFNRFSVSPKMPIEYVRIVLDWGEKPKDIDAHLLKKGNYHISYRNMKASDEAKLDRDDMDSYGPETITIYKVDENQDYYYFVHNYSNRNNKNSSKLSKSRACVSVFGKGDKLLKRFVVPQNKAGVYWNVFQIKNGEIQMVNKILKTKDFITE